MLRGEVTLDLHREDIILCFMYIRRIRCFTEKRRKRTFVVWKFYVVLRMEDIYLRKIEQGKAASKLKIIPLGGLEQIGLNITAFEYEDSIIVVDCGLSFPEDEMLGWTHRKKHV